jgi:hypothetical protein
MFKEYTALEYLKIDIASNYDTKVLEKSNFETRINWFDSNEQNLDILVESAENTSLFFAGLQAYKKHLNNEPTGYLISLDACASGIQLLSVLIGCEKSIALCGLNNNNRIDVYTTLYDMMGFNTNTFERKPVKQAIMTTFYSSQAEPKKLFGENTPELAKFYSVLEKELPGPWMLNKALEALWSNLKLSHDYILPDGFNVHLPVMVDVEESFKLNNQTFSIKTKINKPSDNYRSISANIIHSVDGFVVRELHRRCNYDPKKLVYITSLFGLKSKSNKTKEDLMVNHLWNNYLETNILSLNILEYLNEDNIGLIDTEVLAKLLLTLPMKPFELLSIHDAFKCHPNYGNDIRKQYNQLLSEIANSNLLASIAKQITGDNTITVNKIANISDLVLNTNYALS